jgi:hypothetical protein
MTPTKTTTERRTPIQIFVDARDLELIEKLRARLGAGISRSAAVREAIVIAAQSGETVGTP